MLLKTERMLIFVCMLRFKEHLFFVFFLIADPVCKPLPMFGFIYLFRRFSARKRYLCSAPFYLCSV